MIDVRIKCFGPVRDIVGKPEIVLSVPPPYTGRAAFAAVRERFPDIAPWESSMRLAVNLTYVPFDHPLAENDEVCFIPPVSGG